MNTLKRFRVIGIMILCVLFLVIVQFNYSAAANFSENARCSAGRCEQLKAKLKRMETNPDKLSKKEFLKRVRAACREMERRKCPIIPDLCYTDF